MVKPARGSKKIPALFFSNNFFYSTHYFYYYCPPFLFLVFLLLLYSKQITGCFASLGSPEWDAGVKL